MAEAIDVLLVDDSLADVTLTLRAIQAEEFSQKFKVLRDGEEALNFLFRQGPYVDRHTASSLKLVILDLKLPKVNGFEVLKVIKGDPEMKIIPVVILTSSSQESDIRTSYELGANSYIQKPVNYDEFRTVMQRIRGYWLEVNRMLSVYK